MDAVFAVGHRRFQHMGLAVLCAPVGYRWCGCGRTELADGRFSYESHDRRAYGGGLGRVRPAARRRHGVASWRVLIGFRGRRGCVDFDSDGTRRTDSVRTVRRVRGGDRRRLRIRVRAESGANPKTFRSAGRTFGIRGIGHMVGSRPDSRVLHAYCAEHVAGTVGAAVDERRNLAACGGRPDLSRRRRRRGRPQLGTFPCHIRAVHQHPPVGRGMAGPGRDACGHSVESVRRCPA